MVDIYRSHDFEELEAARLQGAESEAEAETTEAETKPAKKAHTKVVKAKG